MSEMMKKMLDKIAREYLEADGDLDFGVAIGRLDGIRAVFEDLNGMGCAEALELGLLWERLVTLRAFIRDNPR
jgi:hypothetical protein